MNLKDHSQENVRKCIEELEHLYLKYGEKNYREAIQQANL